MKKRKGFTLIEVLISIALLGMIIVPLFSVVDMMRKSNDNLLRALKKSKQITEGSKILFLDILSSDGNLQIKKDEFTRLCIAETASSLYNLHVAKVCWVVLKKKNILVRAEGNGYKMPLSFEDRVEVDSVMENVEIFDVIHNKDKVIVVLKQKGQKALSFMVQGITNPVLRVLKDGTKIMRDGRKILPNGTIIYKDGSKQLADGTIVRAPKKKNKSRKRKRRTPKTRNTQARQKSVNNGNTRAIGKK